MSHSLPSRQLLRAGRTLWLALLLGCSLSLAPSAMAAPVSITGTDPTDATNPKIDLTGAKVVYDAAVGSATVSLQTVAAGDKTTGIDMFVVLGKAVDGKCEPNGEVSRILAFTLVWRSDLDTKQWLVTGADDPGTATTTRTGTTITSSAGPDARLKDLALDCAFVQANSADASSPGEVDYLTIFAAGAGGADKDKDGVPDASDKCPTVAGGDRYGCLSISAKLAVRLGAKRVAIDKMVARTGNACPVKAKVTVKSGSKTIGSGVISVTSHGSFCRAYGVVKLKKSAKKAKITVKGTGMGSIAATRKR